MALPTWSRRLVAVLAVVVTTLSLAATSASALPGGPPPRPTTQNAPNDKSVQQVCPATGKELVAHCLSLRRTDVAAKRGVQPAADTPAGYGPGDLHSAYNLPTDAGAGEIVAIVDAYDDPNAEADLGVYRQQYGLPPCTTANGCFMKVNQTGEQGNYPTPDPDWSGEISLDLDMVSAICPQCHILLVEGNTPNITDLGTSVNTAVALGAKYVSNSYSLSGERSDESTYDPYYNHPGVAVTVSSGDDGTGAAWPPTSPYVTAVGGTSLVRDSSARGWSESVWNNSYGAPGSGCSQYEDKPAFQTDTGCAKRAEADVSAVADPATGVSVYQTYGGNGWAVYGGTSASAPIIAATYALAGTPVTGTYPNSYPYAMPGALNDVTAGNNGTCDISYICTAGAGYDGPTGLGTPNGLDAFRTGPHGTLTGKITDKATGAAVSGADVAAGDAHAVSAADGTYTLSLPVGSYDVTASAYAYKPLTKTGIAITDGGTTTADFALTAVPQVNLSGTVTDGSGHGWPLYAKVTIDGVPGAPSYTDPFTGRYSVQLPTKATYTMHVAPVYPGYLTQDVTVKLGSADLVRNVAVKVDTSACDTAPGYHTAYSGMIQHFDGTTTPAGWTITDNNGSGGVWTFDDPGSRGNGTGGTGNFAVIDSDHLGSGHSQDTTLTSPVVNLSNDPSPVLDFNTYYRAFSNSTADVDLSVDGGATWANVWHQATDSVQGPVDIPLAQAAGKSAVQVRFHYTGTWAWYWEVDDVLVGHKSCARTPGGLVAGFTTDGNTGDALSGVTVTSNDHPADVGVSAKTPDDGNIPDGFYWLFSSLTGAHPFTATFGKYTPATKTVSVPANYVARLDLALAAGRLAITPASLSVTERMGVTKTKAVTFSNTGTQPVHVKIGERDGGFQIKGKPAAVAYAGVRGAAVQHVVGKYLPTRMTAQKSAKQQAVRANAAPADAPWQAIADYPTPISNNGVAYLDGKIYSVGGYNGGDDVASGYVYDPGTLAWTPIADMATTREAPGAAFVGGKLYVVGGWGPDASPVGATGIYDPSTNSWSAGAANPKPHAGAGVAVLDGKIYVVGGCNDSCGNTDVQVYDPASDSWSSAAPYPTAISWLACGGIAGELYCAGGSTGSASTTAGYAYDPSSNAWTPIADMPADDWGGGYAAANGQLLVSGGVIDGSTTLTNEGWAFDPNAGTWTSLPNSNNALYRVGSACGFYKIGGSVSNLDPAHKQAEVLPGYDTCDSNVDVPWLSESQTEFDVAAGASVQVTVTFDSSVVAQPGTYKGDLTISTDTPYTVAPVPVTMNVNPPTTWGKITGTVTGVACNGTSAPIAGATVQIDTWATSYTLTTGKDGTYALWLDYRNNPLTLIVAKDGWQPQVHQEKIAKLKTTTANFALKPAQACK